MLFFFGGFGDLFLLEPPLAACWALCAARAPFSALESALSLFVLFLGFLGCFGGTET